MMVGSHVILIVSISMSQNPIHANHSALTFHSTHQTQKVCCPSSRKSELPGAMAHHWLESAAALAAATTLYRDTTELNSIETARSSSTNALRLLRRSISWIVEGVRMLLRRSLQCRLSTNKKKMMKKRRTPLFFSYYNTTGLLPITFVVVASTCTPCSVFV